MTGSVAVAVPTDAAANRRVSTTPGNLQDFEIVPGNTGNLLECS